MDSLAYKELCLHFAKDLQRISEEIDAAAEKKARSAAALPAVATAREKVLEYERTLAKLQSESAKLAAQFAKAFEDEIEEIRECLGRIAGKA